MVTLTDAARRWLEEDRERKRVPPTFGVRISSVGPTDALEIRHVAERRLDERAIEADGVVLFLPAGLETRRSGIE